MAAQKKFTALEVKKHNSVSDLWFIINDKVYDVTGFIEEHPGGEEVFMDVAGSDATDAFNEIGHSKDAHSLLKELQIGVVDKSAAGIAQAKKAALETKTVVKKEETSSSVVLIVAFLIPIIAYTISKLL